MTEYINKTLDDTNVLITYLPSGEWTPSSLVGCYNNTCTMAHGYDSTLTFTFPENAVALYFYGIKGSPPLAFFKTCIDCSLDSPDSFELQATPPKDAENLLYVRRFDTPGIHNFSLKASPKLLIDRFNLEVPINSDTSFQATPSALPSSAFQWTAQPLAASFMPLYFLVLCIVASNALVGVGWSR